MQSTKRQKKITITATLADKLNGAKSIVMTDYRGLTTAQLLELRQKLAQAKADYTITKNTLLRRALIQKGLEIERETLEGPTACLFSYEDEVAPLKVLVTFAQATQLPKVKGGYLGQSFLSAQRVTALSKLPTKEVLLVQLMGTIQAPTVGLVQVLNGNIRNLVYALNAIKDKKAAS